MNNTDNGSFLLPPKHTQQPHHTWWLKLYLMRHLHACFKSLDKLIRQPITSIITIVVIGISLALPTSINLLLKNVSSLSNHWNRSIQISLYLKKTITQPQTQTLISKLQANNDIAKLQYISPDEGLKEFQKQSGFGDILSELHDNPLPAVIILQPHLSMQSPDRINILSSSLKQLPEIDLVQLDTEWVKRLYYLIDLGKKIATTMLSVLGIGVILIIHTAIRSVLSASPQEIAILKLFGANHAFIRRPFLYTGLWYGLFGGVTAWFLINLLIWRLQEPINNIINSYHSDFVLSILSMDDGIKLISISMLLGLVGSWLAAAKSIRNN